MNADGKIEEASKIVMEVERLKEERLKLEAAVVCNYKITQL